MTGTLLQRHGFSSESDLRLSNRESFRLFSEGVRALANYERTWSSDSLMQARARLASCVEKYPADLLPQFFLGLTESLRGYEGRPSAIANLRKVVARGGSHSLRLSAQYNLAATYLEEYEEPWLERSEELLAATVAELRSHGGDRVLKPLYYQARSTLLCVRVLRRVWGLRNRELSEDERITTAANEIGGELDAFEHDFAREDISRVQGSDETWAEHWNNRGLILLTLAMRRKKAGVAWEEHAHDAVSAFHRALDFKPEWPAARANLAVVYCDIYSDDAHLVQGEQIWLDLMSSPSESEYANYNLGKIAEKRGHPDHALQYYWKARSIAEARAAAERILAGQDDGRLRP